MVHSEAKTHSSIRSGHGPAGQEPIWLSEAYLGSRIYVSACARGYIREQDGRINVHVFCLRQHGKAPQRIRRSVTVG